ncbi:putative TupA-like ATPgrasp [Candidatus Methylobacter favarea]|uniref:Putative TupA-like ATPgrasp n=1 Tax=Candidatus Methylobacter favarea TaxID=2707345 RepID=A0A8S0Y6H8_9GAMM|nr:ATP-grasp fold amidoligase family protein [Candidatus Methylobacter favarea]CAA9891415.1 putative TupA-like ATPgrasp [Candidatus Methylobacter favarea]
MKIGLYYFLKRLAYTLPDPIVFRLRFLWKHSYWPNLSAPRSLTEKILWLMAWDSNPLRAKVADRIKVREFVHELAPSCKSPKQLWSGDSLTADIWNGLPKEFVLKANHGSHMTYIVDKQQDTIDEIVKMSGTWLTKDYSLNFGEWVYQNIPRVLIAEEKLDIEGKIPPDWKFFCANGKVFLVMLNTDRDETSEYDTFYLPDFTRLPNLSMDYDYRQTPDVDEPSCFKDAIRIAEHLSAPFDFIRVDLYLIGPNVYFGEMTCFPSAGSDAIKPINLDFEFGSQIKLDKSFVNLVPRSIWINPPERLI